MLKVNATSLRLKNRVNWTCLFKTQNLYNYRRIIYEISSSHSNIDFLLKRFLFSESVLSLKKTWKKTSAIFQILISGNDSINQKLKSKKEKSFWLRTSSKKQSYYWLNKFFFENNNFNLQLTNLFKVKTFWFYILDADGQMKWKLFGSLKPKSLFTLWSARFFSRFLYTELNRQKKTGAFKKLNINHYILRFLKIFNKNILGLKLIIKGRWQKTQSGRKQKLCFNYGKTQTISMKTAFFFDNYIIWTRFGSASIKVWVFFRL